jgi:hypothetical protein
MRMKKLGARIEKTWRGGGCKFTVGYKYHWPYVVIRLLSKIPIVSMFIRIVMHFLVSCKRVISIIVSVSNKNANNLFINTFFEGGAIHTHPQL